MHNQTQGVPSIAVDIKPPICSTQEREGVGGDQYLLNHIKKEEIEKRRAHTSSTTCSGGEWGRYQGSLKVFGPMKYILCTWLCDSSFLFVSIT